MNDIFIKPQKGPRLLQKSTLRTEILQEESAVATHEALASHFKTARRRSSAMMLSSGIPDKFGRILTSCGGFRNAPAVSNRRAHSGCCSMNSWEAVLASCESS